MAECYNSQSWRLEPTVKRANISSFHSLSPRDEDVSASGYGMPGCLVNPLARYRPLLRDASTPTSLAPLPSPRHAQTENK